VKLCYFNDWRLGVIKGDQTVVDITDAVKDIPHLHTRDLIIGLIERWDSHKAKVEKAAAASVGVPLKGVVAANAIAPSHHASPTTAQATRLHLVTLFRTRTPYPAPAIEFQNI